MKKRIGGKNVNHDSLLIRLELMRQLINVIERDGWTQTEAAKHLGVAQARISEIKTGKVKLFTIDILVNMLAAFNRQVTLKVKKVG